MKSRCLHSDRLMSVQEVSVHLNNVPLRTVRHWASTGVLRAEKYGKLWKFGPGDVETSARRLSRHDEQGGGHDL
jgi:excisionase family DNA binding protein